MNKTKFFEEIKVFKSFYDEAYVFLSSIKNLGLNESERVKKHLIIALSYKMITNSYALLDLMNKGYYSEAKALMRVLIEYHETSLFFDKYPNKIEDWTKGKYKMSNIISLIQKDDDFPQLMKDTYLELCKTGAHSTPDSVGAIFTIDLGYLLIKDMPQFNEIESKYLLFNLLFIMGAHLIHLRDIFEDQIHENTKDVINKVIKRIYDTAQSLKK